MDTANTIIGLSRVSIGGLAAVIAAHNHINGNPEPSREDLQVTRQLIEAEKLMGVPLLDHLIITDSGYTSLAERGLMG